MLRFDRYLVTPRRALDLASGRRVELVRAELTRGQAALFQTRRGATLIDIEATMSHRIEVWERWSAQPRPPRFASVIVDFVELLTEARLGAPRTLALPPSDSRHHDLLRRVLAREARIRGWVPIDLELLARLSRTRHDRFPGWLVDRSLVLFAGTPGLSGDAALMLLRLARRDARPHVLVQSIGPSRRRRTRLTLPPQGGASLLHEGAGAGDARDESTARWRWLLARATASPEAPQRALQLARVLLSRGQPFEARAMADAARSDDDRCASEASEIVRAIDAHASAATTLCGGWEMVDDYVNVLRLCQDVEDEHVALARVGTFVRDRLQASSVAFVVREGTESRILSRVGADTAATTLALQTMESGVAVGPGAEGPAESAYPVRHASEVIGVLWCRWSAGRAIASAQASTLIGVAAAAAAPSVRLALARQPLSPSAANPVPELVGESALMLALRESIMRAAASPFPVIVEGESGCGKELVARAIHTRSVRRSRRFCPINCAALVDELVEAELFGHARGAFTGANSERAGVFEEANGGTLFMDEIAELGPRVQAKLLRALQEGEVRRVGETHVRKVDVRIVAATNRPLAQEVAAQAFRADLWYRLDVIRLTLPPLRERIEDLPLLVRHLWQTLGARTGSRAALSGATVAALGGYPWPGNIRELQNVLASLMVSAPRSGLIGPSSLPDHVARAAALERGSTLAAARRRFDERYVRAALARSGNRPVHAARDLGLSRQGLSKIMGRLGIDS